MTTTRNDGRTEESLAAEATREELTRSNARLKLLAELSHQFSTSIDLSALLATIVRSVADLIGDGCSVVLLDERAEALTRAASAHRDPELDSAFKEVFAQVSIPSHLAKSVVATVARTGRPAYVPDASPESMVERATDALKPLVRKLNIHSLLAVPLRGRAGNLGTLSLMRSGSGRSYTQADLTLLTDVADRASLAIQNAQLLEVTRAHSAELAEANTVLRQHAAVLEGITEAVISLDANLCVRTWNRGAEELLGWTLDEVKGRSLAELIDAGEGDPSRNRALQQLRAEGAWSGERTQRHKQGGTVTAFVTASALKDETGKVLVMLVIARDLTKQRETERATRQLEQQVLQSERLASVGMLAAGVAHEINNPLSYVRGNLELILRRIKQEPSTITGQSEFAQLVDDARDGADRIARIVQGLQTFSRVERMPYSPLSLQSALETAVSLSQNELKQGARLLRSYAPTPAVMGDEGRLVQVFVNLLVNAAHALKGSVPAAGNIQIITRTDAHGRAVAEVKDTGAGIPESHREQIFDAFFTTKPVGTGTGLGLSISRNIIEAHGGEISFESAVGRGTTFRVTLPAATVAALSVPPQAATERESVGVERGKVLVVDDEPMIGRYLTALMSNDHDVSCYTSASEALMGLRAGARFDLILCDLMMPGFTGMDLHTALQSFAPDQAERMTFITGGAFTVESKQFLETVPNARLDKPFNAAKVRELSRTLLRLRGE
jgi:PAS domain S-box-containing protein